MGVSVKNLLVDARDIITDVEHWCQQWHAIDNTGLNVDPLNPEACAWCADGALMKAIGEPEADTRSEYIKASRLLSEATRALFKTAGLGSIGFPYVSVNDGEIGNPDEAHENILKVFDKAIGAVC